MEEGASSQEILQICGQLGYKAEDTRAPLSPRQGMQGYSKDPSLNLGWDSNYLDPCGSLPLRAENFLRKIHFEGKQSPT